MGRLRRITYIAAQIALRGRVDVTAPQAELLILLEGSDALSVPQHTIKLNGSEVQPLIANSDAGWTATQMPPAEHWLFLRVPLSQGPNTISAELLVDKGVRLSAWAWATKPGKADSSTRHFEPFDRAQDKLREKSAFENKSATGKADSSSSLLGMTLRSVPNSLPSPELISLDAIPLLQTIDTSAITSEPRHIARPIERIDGIYLDSLEPTSTTQGWGTLQKNKSVWEKPLMLAGKRYLRGLGTHSPAKIVYSLDGRYKRFQSTVGLDDAATGTVSFEVWLDGEKRWESGPMKRGDNPKPVDIDLTGAKTLELIVGDCGDGAASDHADWAEAKLLR